MDGTMDLTGKTELELRAMEREIAKQHLDKFPYLSLAWGLGNLVCWLSVPLPPFPHRRRWRRQHWRCWRWLPQ